MIKFNFKIFLPLLFLSAGCAILQPAKVEGPGNPFPITTENELSLRSLRSIAVAPFMEGKSVPEGWAEETARLLESRRVSIEGPDMVKIFFARIKKPVEQISGEERPKLAQRIGKALKTDGVMMGVISPTGMEDNRRIHIELIQTSTGKVLWWQAMGIFVKRGQWESLKDETVKRVIPDLLGQLPFLLGTSERLDRPDLKKPSIDISPM